MAKHRLQDKNISRQRWRNINKTDDKTSHLTMILRIKVGYQTSAMAKHRLQTNVRWRNIDYKITRYHGKNGEISIKHMTKHHT